uniref:Uncharacterized protein n=1 Tax=Amphimedon queenslandica TaxID=400682 RepID=A0A1X7UTH6_AMPQE
MAGPFFEEQLCFLAEWLRPTTATPSTRLARSRSRSPVRGGEDPTGTRRSASVDTGLHRFQDPGLDITSGHLPATRDLAYVPRLGACQGPDPPIQDQLPSFQVQP